MMQDFGYKVDSLVNPNYAKEIGEIIYGETVV